MPYIPWVIWHMLRQVGEQQSCSEANVFSWVMESVRELMEVNLAILISIYTHHDVLYFLAVKLTDNYHIRSNKQTCSCQRTPGTLCVVLNFYS